MSFDIKPPQKKQVTKTKVTPKVSVTASKKSATRSTKRAPVKRSASTQPPSRTPLKRKKTTTKKSRGPLLVLSFIAVIVLGLVGLAMTGYLDQYIPSRSEVPLVQRNNVGIVERFSATTESSEVVDSEAATQVPVPAVVQKQAVLNEQIGITKQFTDSVINYDISLWKEINNYLGSY